MSKRPFTAPLPQRFASEVDLQRFLESTLLPAWGLDVLASSLPGSQRVGFIDTLAVDSDGRLFVIECKWDRVDRSTVDQLSRYRSQCLDQPTFPLPWMDRRKVTASNAVSVAVGHCFRFSPKLTPDEIRGMECWQYSYPRNGLVQFQRVDDVSLKTSAVGVPAVAVDKRHKLAKYLDRTTPAAREAYEQLLRRLDGAGFVPTFPGKNRMRLANREQKVQVTFGDLALQCFVSSQPAFRDTKGRVGLSTKSGYRWAYCLAGPEDVQSFVELLGVPETVIERRSRR